MAHLDKDLITRVVEPCCHSLKLQLSLLSFAHEPSFGQRLRDPPSAPMNGLAGALQGLANQVVLVWPSALQKELGGEESDDKLRDYIWNTLGGWC
ncbi:citrate synthase, mitochondrial-like [Anguilla anguilla]|uniref:citrate synthase, mitochondrial-like n=1 Tax=Anguilla anguilla TaxID=7936 RepID=UPI0015AD1B6A|nr:citrate synthase, mitochondrial-like [Anguilla anguilla]